MFLYCALVLTLVSGNAHAWQGELIPRNPTDENLISVRIIPEFCQFFLAADEPLTVYQNGSQIEVNFSGAEALTCVEPRAPFTLPIGRLAAGDYEIWGFEIDGESDDGGGRIGLETPDFFISFTVGRAPISIPTIGTYSAIVLGLLLTFIAFASIRRLRSDDL